MSAETDENDARTFESIGRRPGIKRRDAGVVKASVERLVRAGLVIPPSSNGRLYPTDAGLARLARDAKVIDNARGLGVKHGYPCDTPEGQEWHLIGVNRAGHPLWLCGTSRHLAVQPHPSESHDCVTSGGCDSPEPAARPCGIRDCDCHLASS